ncbi:hypothetical protein GOODEAATRI_007498 [Goodea atripinnis]|uniref:Uncharacterized protein n=1 Tax=Goodea atripinnis TaxID=208336 RepID=A0ABV0P287_9TELE
MANVQNEQEKREDNLATHLQSIDLPMNVQERQINTMLICREALLQTAHGGGGGKASFVGLMQEGSEHGSFLSMFIYLHKDDRRRHQSWIFTFCPSFSFSSDKAAGRTVKK